jgi:hypothetical protein
MLFLGKTGVWTQGLSLVRKTLYHLSHTSSPLCSSYFGDRVLLKPAWTVIPLFLVSHVAWDDKHGPLHPAIGWDEVLRTICLGWPGTAVILISASWVARITSLSLQHWAFPPFHQQGNR